MGMRLTGRAAVCCALGLLVVTGFVLAPTAFAGDSASSSSSASERVELFEAIEAEQIAVTVIPQKAERVTLQIANKTDRPLSIEVPAALAAAPVLAQFPGLPNAGNNGGNTNNAPQSVGFPGMNNGLNNGNNGMGQNPFGMNPGIFNVPAGKVIKVKLPAACLEFGKRTPNSRMPYELTSLESVTDKPEVAAILGMIGRREVTRRVGQLAIWNVANGKSWKDLAAIKADHIGGLVAPQYSSQEIAKAQQLVEKLERPDRSSVSRR